MSLYNEILAGRYNKQILKLFNMKGGAPAPQVSGDVACEIALETDRPEWGYLKGENFWGKRINIGNGAASNSRARLRLTASNVLCVLTSVRAYSISIASEFILFIGGASFGADLTDVVASGVLAADSRLPQTTPGNSWNQSTLFPLLASGQNTDTATAGNAFSGAAAAINTSVELLPTPLIMSSRSIATVYPIGVDVQNVSLNAALNVSFRGYVRALEESEYP